MTGVQILIQVSRSLPRATQSTSNLRFTRSSSGTFSLGCRSSPASSTTGDTCRSLKTSASSSRSSSQLPRSFSYCSMTLSTRSQCSSPTGSGRIHTIQCLLQRALCGQHDRLPDAALARLLRSDLLRGWQEVDSRVHEEKDRLHLCALGYPHHLPHGLHHAADIQRSHRLQRI